MILTDRAGINIEYSEDGGFPRFVNSVAGKRIELLYDINTEPYAARMYEMLIAADCDVVEVEFPDEELLPTEDKCDFAGWAAKGCDYVLAVGSGTLNDMAKYIAFCEGVPSGVMATAASMDGYCSSGAALMRGGLKVTDSVRAPRDILIDPEIIRCAPRELTAAGFGDIIGKYTCLADWKLSNLINGEPIHAEAYSLMERALGACVEAYVGLTEYRADAIAELMDALITAGISMAMCGNSRPASGSEHHQSHFLEMDFARRGEPIPPHGIKVGIGTLVSLSIYKYIADHRVPCKNAEQVYALARSLPDEETVRDMLVGMGAPVRFSEIGVREETMRRMLFEAHTVRDRYTVLTLAAELGIMDDMIADIMEKYF